MKRNKEIKQYVFGYGSLINPQSRKKSTSSTKAFPVKVKGIRRSWSFLVDLQNEKATALGASYLKNSVCNGVLIEVSEKQLKDFDKREKSVGYKRIRIKNKDIKSLTSFDLQKNSIVWVYVGTKLNIATIKYPILQSYLDVIIIGALKISENFAKEFVKNTRGWSVNWENDRKKPRYIRAMKNVENSKMIDSILKEGVNKFKKRK